MINCHHIYIYPRGRRFTGNSCPKGVYIYEVGVGLGWGGVGMVTFLELAHMVGATQHHVPCTCTHGRCYASHGMGWGGDGNVTCTHGRCYATSCSLHLHTWSVLRNIMFLALAHMVGATQVMGWGGVGNNLCGKCKKNTVMCWWKIKYFSPQKWNDIVFIPLHSPFSKCRGGKSFHTHLLLYAV